MMVEGRGIELGLWACWCCWEGGRARRRRSSNGEARRTVKDFTTNWPPNLSPLTSELGLNVGSVGDLFGCWGRGIGCGIGS